MKVIVVLAVVCALAYGAEIRKHYRRPPQPDGRIVGGVDTLIQRLPYQLSLMHKGWHMCGASIIGSYWALTAGHCVEDRLNPKMWSLRAGTSIVDEGGSIHQAAEIFLHPLYDGLKIDYDYALVRVEEPFPLGQSGVEAIRLADKQPEHGAPCVASGWGALWAGGPASSILQSVWVPIVGLGRCKELYAGWTVTDRMVCAGLEQGGADACQGDSGGPLVTNKTLVGIVSWGYGCAYAGYPGLYANVAVGRDWIRGITGI